MWILEGRQGIKVQVFEAYAYVPFISIYKKLYKIHINSKKLIFIFLYAHVNNVYHSMEYKEALGIVTLFRNESRSFNAFKVSIPSLLHRWWLPHASCIYIYMLVCFLLVCLLSHMLCVY